MYRINKFRELIFYHNSMSLSVFKSGIANFLPNIQPERASPAQPARTKSRFSSEGAQKLPGRGPDGAFFREKCVTVSQWDIFSVLESPSCDKVPEG